MRRFFRSNPLVLLACALVLAPCALALEVSVDTNDRNSPDIEFTMESETEPEIEVYEDPEPVTVETESDDKQIILNVTVTPPSVAVNSEAPVVNVEAPVVNVEAPAVETAPLDSVEFVEESPDDTDLVPAFIPHSVLSLTNSSGTSSDAPTDTIRAVLEALFGEYQPRTQTVTHYLEDGFSVTYDEYVPGLAGMDWTWIASVLVFGLMLFCLFRLLGGVIVHG